MVAEVGETAEQDQLYRITFDGSVADEHGFVAMGGQADQVAAVLKDRYSPGLSMEAALGAAIAALAGQGNGERAEINASQLEVAVLDAGGSTARSAGSPAPGWRTCSPRRGRKARARHPRPKPRRQQRRWRRQADAEAGSEPPPGDGTAP